MLWFQGAIPAAIASAKRSGAVFVVFVAGEGGGSPGCGWLGRRPLGTASPRVYLSPAVGRLRVPGRGRPPLPCSRTGGRPDDRPLQASGGRGLGFSAPAGPAAARRPRSPARRGLPPSPPPPEDRPNARGFLPGGCGVGTGPRPSGWTS